MNGGWRRIVFIPQQKEREKNHCLVPHTSLQIDPEVGISSFKVLVCFINVFRDLKENMNTMIISAEK